MLALAAVGAVSAWIQPRATSRGRERTFWTRYLTCNVAIAAAIFSAIPYKTPWNLLPFYLGAIVLAGIGFSTLVDATASRAVRAALVAAPADRVRPPRVAGVARVGDLRGGPAQSLRLRAHGPRRRPHGDAHPRAGPPASRRRAHAGVGHRAAARAVAAPLVSPDDAERRLLDRAGRTGWPCRRRSSSPRSDNADALDAALGDRYVSEFFGLRPEVLLALYIERGLWERFLARGASAQ